MQSSMPFSKHASRMLSAGADSLRNTCQLRPQCTNARWYLRPRLAGECVSLTSVAQLMQHGRRQRSDMNSLQATMNGKQRLYYTAPFCKQCFCLHRLIIVSRETLKPCHAQSESSAPANEEGQESSGDESSIQLSMPRRSRMVTFTCNKCGERPIPHHYLALSSASKGKACRATGLHKHGLAV